MTVYVVDRETGKVVPKGTESQSRAPIAHARPERRFVDHTLQRRNDAVAMKHCRCQAKGNPDRDAHHRECQFYRMTRLTHLYPRTDRYGRPCFQSEREVDEFVAKARHNDPKAAHLVYDRKGEWSY